MARAATAAKVRGIGTPDYPSQLLCDRACNSLGTARQYPCQERRQATEAGAI
jgi:hypothetical protein